MAQKDDPDLSETVKGRGSNQNPLKYMDSNQNCCLPEVKDENQNCCVHEVGDEIRKNLFLHRDSGLEVNTKVLTNTNVSEDGHKQFQDGLHPQKYEAIKRTIHNLVWATKKEKIDPFESFFQIFSGGRKKQMTSLGHADKHLRSVLKMCSVRQRKELMMLRSKKYFLHTPLSLACKVRNLDLVMFLVEQCSADVNGVDHDGRPLLWAVAKQEEKMVHYLLKMGADAGIEVGKGYNVLLFAMKVRLTAQWPPFGYEESYDWNEEEKKPEPHKDYLEDSDENMEDEEDHVKRSSNDEDHDWTDVDSDEESDDLDEDDEEDRGHRSDDDVECRISLLRDGEEKIPVPLEPSFNIVKMLVAHGALKKCSQNQLFEIFQAILPEESTNVIVCGVAGRLYERCLPLFIKLVPKIANIRNSQGMTLLGHELLHKDYNYKRCQISSYIEPFLEESDGSDINDANVLKYITIPQSELVPDTEETIETNVDNVLNKCRIHPVTLEVVCEENNSSSPKYIHPVVFLAASGKSLLSTCLNKPKIPFSAKFDALEIAGANFAKWEYYEYAYQCWDAANSIRSQIIVRKVKKRDSIKNIFSKWEEDIDINPDIVEHLPCGYYDSHQDWDTVYNDFDEDPDDVITTVQDAFHQKMKTGIVPDISVKSPAKSLIAHLSEFNGKRLDKDANDHARDDKGDSGRDESEDDSEDEDEAYERVRIAVLAKSVAVHERLIGFGCHQTMRAYHALAIEYKRMKKIPEMVTVITYSFPYLVRYVPQEEYYAVSSITKTYTLNKFMNDLGDVFRTKSKYDQLSFDLKMAALKCLYLDCLSTPRKDREFLKFAPLLVAIKVMHAHTCTCTSNQKDEELRFSQFVRKVAREDIRNCFGQSLLHYAVPYVKKTEQMMLEQEVTGSVELVETLLSFGANPNASDDFGMTPLHLAFRTQLPDIDELYNESRDSHVKIIQMLMNAGAHADCVDASGQTPIDYSDNTSHRLCQVGDRQLQCLASVAILKNSVPYKGHVSSHLEKFIDMHKKQGNNTSGDFLKRLITKEKKSNMFVF